MLNINSVQVTGRLTRDPELRKAGDSDVVNASIAISNPRQVNGEWKDDPTYLDVAFFNKSAEAVMKYRKGEAVYIEGKLKQDRWEKDGQKMSKIGLVANVVKKAWPSKDDAKDGTPAVKTGKPSDGLDFSSDAQDDIPF